MELVCYACFRPPLPRCPPPFLAHLRMITFLVVGFTVFAAVLLLRHPAYFPAQTASEPPTEGSFASAEFILPLADVDWKSEEGAAVLYFLRRGVIGGFSDGLFRGHEPVTRADAAKILLLAGGFHTTHLRNNGRFLDVAECEWYTPYIASIAARGIIHGYPPRHILFALRNPVNTAEFLKMLTLTFGLRENLPHSFSDVPHGAWYARYTGAAWQYSLFSSRGEFLQADRPLSRREVLIALYRLFTVQRPRGRPGSEWYAPTIPTLPALPVTQLFKVGSLSVLPDTIPTPAHQLIVGLTGDPILRFRVEADDVEDIAITHVKLMASGSTTVSVDSLSLYIENNTKPFARATREACGGLPSAPSAPVIAGDMFCAHLRDPLIIRKPLPIPGCPTGVAITIRPLLHTLATGAVSGSVFHVFLPEYPSFSAVAAHGNASHAILAKKGAAGGAPVRVLRVVGNDNLVVTGKFASVATDERTASLVSGTTSLASFRFTAHPQNAEAIALHGLIFTVSASNASLQSDAFTLFDPANPAAKSPCVVAVPADQNVDAPAVSNEVTGTFAVLCDSLASSPMNASFTPGKQRQFILEGNVAPPRIDQPPPSSLQVSLDSFSTPAAAFAPSASHVRWFFGTSETFWIEHPDVVLRSTLFESK